MLGALLGALLAVSCFLFATKPAWFPSPISSFGLQFDSQFSFTLVIAAIAFVLLHLALIAAIFLPARHGLFRHTAREMSTRRQGLCEIAWTAFVAAVFLFLAFGGVRIWAGISPLVTATAPETIEVYAHQFAWNFRYPGNDGKFGHTSPTFINDVLENSFGVDPGDPAGKDDIFSATLRVPAGRDTLLLLHSRDVIHDFFVRELRFKQDVVPGMEIPYRFRAAVPGVYEIACSELCGLGHSQMRAVVEVMPPGQYDRWKWESSLAATTR